MPRRRTPLGAVHIPEFERFVETRDPQANVLHIPLDAVYTHWRAFLAEPAEGPKDQAARRSRSLLRCLLTARGLGERLDRRRMARAREAVRRKPGDPRTDATHQPVTDNVRTLLLWAGYPPERPRRVALRAIMGWMDEHAVDVHGPDALSGYIRHLSPDGHALQQWAVRVAADGGARRLGAVRRLLLRARMHPRVDVDGVFARHRRTVPAAVLLAHPELCQYPAWFGRYVANRVADVDRIHVLQFAQAVADGRMLHSGGGRCPDRTRRSVAAGVRKIVTALRGMAAGGDGDHPRGSVMHLMPRTLMPSDLLNLVAQIVAHTLSRGRCTGPRRTDAPVDGVFRSFIHFFRGAIRNGVFEPSVPCTWRLAATPVQRIMLALERADGTRWRAFPAQNPPQPVRTVPTSDDVVALQAAARDDPMEGLFVELLVTTGIRAEAFANMRWMHLWADGPRTPLCIPEKNSDVRRIMPGDALQCAIRRAHSFASTAQHDGVAVFVFRHPLHHGIPWLGCARTLLVRLCKRMGLHGRGIFTPHQFRAYLVNAAMARGCSLEAVSKWFGHRNVNVTYRYYWTAPSPLPVAACVVVDATPPSTRTASCMHPQSLPPLEPATDADPLERLFGCFP